LLLALVALGTSILTAFDADRGSPVSTVAPASAQRLVPAGPPTPEVVALAGSLRIQLPVSQQRLTAIGYHAAGEDAVALQPLGRRANQGLLARLVHKLFGGGGSGLHYYQLSGGRGPPTAALDVGAAPGTDVYSPIDGTVVAIKDNILSGKRHGVVLDLQPTNAPSMLVSLTHLRPDPSLTVGSPVSAGSSVIGTLVSFKDVERQALARYTQDVGDHVAIEVRQATALALP
jgi:hypothetical protein